MANAKKKIFKVEEVKDLKVTRVLLDIQTKSGADMYGYQLIENMKVNNTTHKIKVDFVAKDAGGYEVLDIIFMGGDEAHLSVREEYLPNESTGELTAYRVYEIWNEDDDGIPYSIKVKPARDSDKAKFDMIINKRRFAFERSQVDTESSAGEVDSPKPTKKT